MRADEVGGEDFWTWAEGIEGAFDPEAQAYRQKNTPKSTDATPVVTKIPDDSPRFTTRAHRKREPSAGWQGRVRAQYRAGHITREEAIRRLGQDT